MSRQHFKSLDTLRFFAFLKVFLLHLPAAAGFPVYQYLKSGGGIGVSFFFVLSGFLISYILLQEKLSSEKERINAPRFFFRRALRIWPLYFTGVILAYAGRFIMHQLDTGAIQSGYSPQWYYSFTFTENYAMIAHNSLPDGAPLAVFWSLCIEEHFYLLWLLVFAAFRVKHIPKVMFAFWGTALLLRLALFIAGYGERIAGKELFTSLDYFAAGALLAYIVTFAKEGAIQWQTGSRIAIIVVVILYVSNQHLMQGKTMWSICEPTVSAILFSLLISAVMSGKGLPEKHILNRLGRISYGLYVYHTVIILAMMKLFQNAGWNTDSVITLVSIAVLSLAVTLLAASVSYRFIEKPFLSLREKHFAYNK